MPPREYPVGRPLHNGLHTLPTPESADNGGCLATFGKVTGYVFLLLLTLTITALLVRAFLWAIGV